MTTCVYQMRAEGALAVPRTCPSCGLGPCKQGRTTNTLVPGRIETIAANGPLHPAMYSPEVTELIQAAIESTDDTPRTARLRAALVPFGVV